MLQQQLKKLESRWPVRIRLLIILLIIEIGALTGVAVALGSAYQHLQLQDALSQPDVRIFLTASLGSLGLAFLITFVTVIWVGQVFVRQVGAIATMVEQQIESGDLNIAVDYHEKDELSRLTRALNKLGQSYQASLNESSRKADELATLNFVAEAINRSFDLEEVLKVSLKEVTKSTGFPKGAIYMFDERTDSLTMVSYEGLTEEQIRPIVTFAPGEGLVGRAAAEMTTLRREDLTTADNRHSGLEMAIPLLTTDKALLGVLTLGGQDQDPLPPDKRRMLVTLTYQIALAIDKARLYEEVRLHAEQLEHKVEQRTQQLNRAVEELSVALEKAQEAERLKTLLLSTVSHELRTPLATIKGNTSLLRKHFDRIDPDTLVEHLHDIETESDKLTALITDLLDMSRIEAGILHIDPHPFDLVDVAQTAVSAAQRRSEGQKIVFAVPSTQLSLANGDPRRIEQVLANLLDNAMKYSEPDTTIRVWLVETADELVVHVADEGQGIEPDHLEHIFDRFYQIKNTGDSGRHGVGLGLAICRGLIESHKGRIWAQSTLNEGSTFSFSLPQAAVPMARMDTV